MLAEALMLGALQAAPGAPATAPTTDPAAPVAPAPAPAPTTSPTPTSAPAPTPAPAQPAPPPPGYAAYPYPYPYPYVYSPPYTPPPKPKEQPKEPITWMVRATLGFGNGAPSEEKQLLSEEGYGIGVTWLEADGSYMFSENIGLGAWGAWAFGGSEPDQDEGGPELNTTSWFLGAEVPLVFGSRSVRVVISPRIGIAWGKVEFGSSGGKYDSGLAFGLELSILFPEAHVGPTFGLIRAPMGPPGELGRDYDAGATFIGVTGVIDG